MQGTVVTLSDYGTTFQNKLFKFLIEDKEFFFKLLDILKPEYFSDKNYSDIFKVMLKHFEKFIEIPNYDILSMYARKIQDPDKRGKLLSILGEFKLQEGDREFILETAYVFCKRNEMKDTMIDCVDLLQKEEYEKIEERITDLIKKISVDTTGHNYWENFDRRVNDTRFNIVPTGWEILDSYLGGGLGSGELGVCAGAPGFGKSHVLVNLAANAARQGKNALIITLELYSNAVETRIDANFTGIEIDKIKFHKDHVKKELYKLKKENNYGEIFVKYFPTGSVTVPQIRAYIDQLKATHFVPDVICIDYADIIRPATKYKDAHRLEQKMIYEDLRGLAGYLNRPIWTASQAGKQTVEKEFIGIEDLSESFGKAMIADVIVGLTRKVEQRLDNQGKMFLAKNRVGKDGIIFPLDIDTSISTIVVKDPDYDMTKDILGGVTKSNSGRINMSSRKKQSLLDELKTEFKINE